MGICVSCRRRERKAPEKRTVPGAGGPAKGAAAAELLPRRGDLLPMMANSMSNYKMTNPIKGIVSKRRRRYMKDGFNLDLAYITDRLIAMGFPAEKLEGVYRNHIDEVSRFLEKKHKDHYKIYNLCSERSYDSSKFHERVERYAFEDHTPPNIEMIQPFCEDVHKWLSEDSRNVAAVHCKAGKGRTGTMVCCYLLYSRQKTTADEALKFYGTKRTHDEKGVTIPSQRRYVEYYAWLLRSGLSYAPTKVHIRELLMTPPPFQHVGQAAPELLITQAHPFFKAPTGCHEVRRSEQSLRVRLTHCTPLCGDVRIDVYKHKMKMRKEKLFHFWFNTFFVAACAGAVPHPPLPDSPNLETFKLTLNKWQLDDAHKDKQHKNYSQDFKVELIVQKMPESATFAAAATRAPSPPSSSASSCSEPEPEPEPDPDPDAHWDSGERFPYSRLPSPALLSDEYKYDYADKDGYTSEKVNAGDKDGYASEKVNAGDKRGCTKEYAGDKDGFTSDKRDGYPGEYGCKRDGYKQGASDKRDGCAYKPEERESTKRDGYKDSKSDGFSDKLQERRQTENRIGSGKYEERFDSGGSGTITSKCDGYTSHECRKYDESLDPSATRRDSSSGYNRRDETSDNDRRLDSGESSPDDPVQDQFNTFNSTIYETKDSARVNDLNRRYPETLLDERLYDPVEDKNGATFNPIYTGRKNSAPTANPLYCSKADAEKFKDKGVTDKKATFEEPMEYANDVFSSAPTSARESPVEECKGKRDDKSKPRLSLDIRASWREFSGKFGSDRRMKEES